MNRKVKKLLLCSCLLSSVFYMNDISAIQAQEAAVHKYIVNTDNYHLKYNGTEPEFKNGINPGYGSGIVFKNFNSDGSLEFYCITDRGPNADIPTYIQNGKKIPGKFFPVPDFTPSIGILKVDKNSAQIIKSIPLKKDSNAISGKVIPSGQVGSTGEIALNFNMQNFGTDINGLDTEGIARDKDGNFWLCDEYGPFIVKVDANGNILEKYGPGMGLPQIIADRVPNRGFEGITIDDDGNIVTFVQSPLDVDGKTEKTAKYTRIIKLNPNTKAVTMYAYPVDTGYKNFSAAKLGDITSIGNNQFLVIEQGKQNGAMQNLIYKIDLNNATPISNNGDLEFGKLDNSITPVKKELVLNLRDYGWNIEKAEGLTVLPDRQTIAVVNDNDFGIAVKVDDPQVKDAQIEDYTYNADTHQFTYKNDTAVHKVNIGLKQNAPTERENQIWFFKLNHKL